MHQSRLKSLAPLALGLCIYLLWPAHALARAVVRFVHAVPGVGTAQVEVTAGSESIDFGSIGFSQSTSWHSLRSGRFLWHLVGSGGKTLASGSATVGDGAFTAVVITRTDGVFVDIYRDRGGEPGKSLIRVIHAAPELGSPQLKFDSQIVDQRLDYTKATPYLSVNPGTHSLAAMRAGDTVPVVSAMNVRLVSGVAYSAIVVGSRGERVRVVTVTDRGAPLTRSAPASRTPRAGHSASPADATRWVTVTPGESLWSIAREHLGPGASNTAVERMVIATWDANVSRIGTGDPNLIFPGQRLHIPVA